MASDPFNESYVYRLIAQADWRAAQKAGVIPMREDDRRSGFLHLSTEAQLLGSARRHFAGETDLVALAIPLVLIAEQVRFEIAPKRGEAFPHYYGDLPTSAVEKALPLRAVGDDFTWEPPA
ncbi:MAG: DUF952 domain-containing protein [Pseudomonadota bacterium]